MYDGASVVIAGSVVSVTGVSSGSSKTISYSVMKREKTGAGILSVGEKTIPTDVSKVDRDRNTISDSHFALLRTHDNSLEMFAHDP